MSETCAVPFFFCLLSFLGVSMAFSFCFVGQVWPESINLSAFRLLAPHTPGTVLHII